MTRIASKKYLAGSRGQTCKFRIPGVCSSDTETVIPAHIRDGHTGRSQKASDISVADACFACHEVFDRRAKLPSGEYLSDADWLFYALRGLQETLEGRIAAGLLFLSQDVVKPFAERTTKRKPNGNSRPIPARQNPWPEAPRKIQSRNNLARITAAEKD